MLFKKMKIDGPHRRENLKYAVCYAWDALVSFSIFLSRSVTMVLFASLGKVCIRESSEQ